MLTALQPGPVSPLTPHFTWMEQYIVHKQDKEHPEASVNKFSAYAYIKDLKYLFFIFITLITIKFFKVLSGDVTTYSQSGTYMPYKSAV